MAALPDITILDRQQLTELLGRVLARLFTPEQNAARDQDASRVKKIDFRLLSAKQVADLWNVPQSWVLDQARAGRLPSVKLGHYVRFKPEDIERFSRDGIALPNSTVLAGGIRHV